MSVSSLNRSSVSVPASRPSNLTPPTRASQSVASTPASQPRNELRQKLMTDSFEQGPSKANSPAGGAPYRIQSGDTLSSIAERNHTSVDALMKANPQIQDKNLIFAGDSLNIPGGKDEFVPAKGDGKADGAAGSSGTQASSGGTQASSGAQASAPAGDAPAGQVGDWIKQAQQILAANGVPADKMNAQQIAAIIQHESSGDPNAVNNWDSNAAAGHPSIGLMQTIQPTFDQYKVPGHDDIRNPVDNIVAAVRYSVARYGSISNVPGVQSMAQGGSYVGY